ncbi:MAG: 50S ribosomal protein L3 N(5)-glutamine methyltransferase [Magnetococcales bacterium]|nr:50S ribosomal protein L3 N(5)-glutamine methyltransferase [Magnetococcales bacterium]
MEVNFSILQEWLDDATARITAAEVSLDSGMQEAYLEAEYLAYHALLRCPGWAGGAGSTRKSAQKRHSAKAIQQWQACLQKPPPPPFAAIFADFLAQRLQQRRPAAYIVGEAPFAGHRFLVNDDVLIPRSRLENLLEDPAQLRRLLGRRRLRSILDLGTGCGCLAIAFALAFPEAQVDGTDISQAALAVAAANGRRFRKVKGMQRRLHWRHSDLFSQLQGRRYSLIISNPPYVTRATLAGLPSEYCHEPALALDGGVDGLALVEPILRQAAQFLTPRGVLICEVGDETGEILMERWPDLPVEWIYFHFGGSGVFAARRAALARWARQTPGTEGICPA